MTVAVPMNVDEAHQILDLARTGVDIPAETINVSLLLTGDLSNHHFSDSLRKDKMKPLHITEPRCAGRDLKFKPTICSVRDTCARHKQLEIDRQIGIEGTPNMKIMNLPFVVGNECHFRIKVAP